MYPHEIDNGPSVLLTYQKGKKPVINFYLYKNVGCYQDDQIVETIIDQDELDKTEITKFTGDEIDQLL